MTAKDSSLDSDRLHLVGSVNLSDLYPVLTEIWRDARRCPGTSFRINCSRVTEFSSHALAELAALGRDVRALGGNLMLTHVREKLWEHLQDPRIESLVEGGRYVNRHKTELVGPHKLHSTKWKPAKPTAKKPREPYFLNLRGTRYQRFWLN
jgi:ABC-type transporter Mla MlaB component